MTDTPDKDLLRGERTLPMSSAPVITRGEVKALGHACAFRDVRFFRNDCDLRTVAKIEISWLKKNLVVTFRDDSHSEMRHR